MTFHDLKVNRMTAPLVVDPTRLSFSFLWEGEDCDVSVTLKKAGAMVCSALVPTRQSHCFSLPFVPEPGTEYTWYVSRGKDVSEPARFETAYPFRAPESLQNSPSAIRPWCGGFLPAAARPGC